MSIRNPYVKVIISSPLPREKVRKARFEYDENSMMDVVNSYLRWYCRQGPFIFMENWSKPNTHRNIYKRDGVHLTVKGNRLLAENIVNSITNLQMSVGGRAVVDPDIVPRMTHLHCVDPV